MITEDFALPTGDEAERLLAGLAHLIRLRGPETFLAAPLLLAEPQYFPDQVGPRAEGVATLLRRLLAYAGLAPKRLIIEIYASSQADPHVVHKGGKEAAAWFMDIADGVYRFGVKETELRDEQALIGTLGHEVAHAYRHHHRLAVKTRETEEQLTDLTTIYLGFGIFTLESSYQFKTGHYDTQGRRLLFERQGRGYLLPGQLAYLLGAQLATRGVREDLLQRALSSLSDNHRAAVKTAVAELRADQPALLQSLSLPPIDDWPSPRGLNDAVAPLPETEVVIRDHAESKQEPSRRTRVAFRVAGSRAALGLIIGFTLGSTMAVVAEMQQLFWPCVAGFAALGAWFGHGRAAPTCSGCGRTVELDAAHCPHCELELVGDIKTKLDLFEAEEHHRTAERKRLAAARLAASASAEHHCPHCQWVPIASDIWSCSCGHRFHTFETQGRCPDCDKLWETTVCLSCKRPSPHADWYRS
ncbi:MAG TPA: hypothetical protein VFK05_04550 [Polyangiaceae bacterium]|nr:hypothetical protein [Polyangiaceae bacterium]